MFMNKILGSAVAGALMLLASPSWATTFFTPVQTQSLNLLDTDQSLHSLVFNKFNPSLGTLTDLHIAISANAYATYLFQNLTNSTAHIHFQSDVTVHLENPIDPNTPLVVTIPNVSDIIRTVGSFASYTSPGWPGNYADPNVLTGSNSNFADYYAPADAAILALFNGNGQISLDVEGEIDWSVNADRNGLSGVLSAYSPTVQIYYSYDVTDVPEPASLAFVGAGLLGLGFARRRKSSKQDA